MPSSYGKDEYYTKRARKEHVPARSYFKLEEIDRRYNILKPGQKVLDLGCWPGSWTLYASQQVGRTGRVMGVDLQKVTTDLPPHAKTVVSDAFSFKYQNLPQLDVVMSDMAPKTMGDFRTDHSRSAKLVQLAMGIADAKVGVGGSFLAKILDGAETQDLLKQLKIRYDFARIVRPKATRSQSNEVYLMGLEKKPINMQMPMPYVAPDASEKKQPKPQPRDFTGW